MAKEKAQQKPKPKPAARAAGTRPDIATLAGLLLALAGIIGGLILEGGSIKDITQITAAMIVLGGTIGAVLVSTPLDVTIGAAKRLAAVFLDRTAAPDRLIEDIIGYATKARKTGVVSLETEAETIADPFLKKALILAVDGTDLQEIRRMMELDIDLAEQRTEAEAKVFESAGGYAPTIGIIGAVLGLIQVMKHLENIEEVGHGIAVAFVATVYGVGVANVFFLPAAAKIKARMALESRRKELILEGVSGIVEGLNPKLIRSKLEAFVPPAAPRKPKPAAAPKTAAAQTAEA
ncbi:MAG TPA: flagellar motor protein [Bryobacteraceae bacterium]|nr:flagellar motor protein [Bryobacteraceae bacterium]